LYEDLKHPNKFRIEVVVPSWKEHLLQSERMTKNEKDILLKLRGLRTDPNPPEEWISLSLSLSLSRCLSLCGKGSSQQES
jgi:ABC-type oligopeptide transport system substrate-binding subunit